MPVDIVRHTDIVALCLSNSLRRHLETGNGDKAEKAAANWSITMEQIAANIAPFWCR